jgi:hypothetical protein
MAVAVHLTTTLAVVANRGTSALAAVAQIGVATVLGATVWNAFTLTAL